ncbi:MAG: hypothetical protein L7F78_22365, partial [Syntrophales bacterium LBB04]|nr:hypothetical protein [Syntrophales bacterium LBB04]
HVLEFVDDGVWYAVDVVFIDKERELGAVNHFGGDEIAGHCEAVAGFNHSRAEVFRGGDILVAH